MSSTDYSSGSEVILTFLASIFIIFLIIAIAFYVLQAVALTKISKRNNFKYWWFSWIPVLNSLVMPMLVEDDVHDSIKGKFTLIYISSFVGAILLSLFIPPITFLPVALTFYAFYIICNWYTTNAPIHLIIGVLTSGLSLPISLIMLSGKERI